MCRRKNQVASQRVKVKIERQILKFNILCRPRKSLNTDLTQMISTMTPCTMNKLPVINSKSHGNIEKQNTKYPHFLSAP
jgi:hypothetical protein